MTLSIFSAVIASVSYALFSKSYEPAVRKVGTNHNSAIILYFLSGLILIFFSLLIAIFRDSSFLEYKETIFFNFFISKENILFFLIAAIFLMANLYALHIVTEARSRYTMNIGIYSIIFQLSFVVLAFSDILIFRTKVSLQNLIGSLLVLTASAAGLLIHACGYGRVEEQRINKKLVFAAILSALSCGFALLIDGEIIRNFVFRGDRYLDSLSFFILYEAITFLIPATIVLGYAYLQSRKKEILNSLLLDFKRAPLSFFFAAFFSASQFVFSVMSLALPGSRLIPAVILGTSPFFCVLIEGEKHGRLFLLELLLAIIIIVGILLTVS